MATRRATHTINQENVTARLNVKSNFVQPVQPVKRPALGEVGNRLQAIQKTYDTKLKQNGCMGPPENVLKPKVSNIPTKKDTLTSIKVNTEDPKKVIKRQESILKNIPNTSTKPSIKPSECDPDENVKNEPQMVPEYLMDIFAYLRELENKLEIRSNFLDNHESTSRMRAILINWLVEVHMNFKCTLDTLHLCIGLVDRYLQENRKVGRNTLQLVGTSAMLIACKYEEVYIPDLEDFKYICDNTFSKKQILQMEIEILKRLDFNLGRPHSIQFLRRYTKIAQTRVEHHNLGKYILELVLLEDTMSHLKPSLLAAAACCLSMGILDNVMDLQKLWTPIMVKYTTYNYQDIRPVISELAFLLVKSEKSKHQAIRKKYSTAKYAKISIDTKLNGPLVRKLTAGRKVM